LDGIPGADVQPGRQVREGDGFDLFVCNKHTSIFLYG
jgi:hypothetical protein